jgi:hypothetical protein
MGSEPLCGYDSIKVFSATKARDREALGEAVTAWIRAHGELRIVEKVVRLSSDESFHCLTIILFLSSASA